MYRWYYILMIFIVLSLCLEVSCYDSDDEDWDGSDDDDDHSGDDDDHSHGDDDDDDDESGLDHILPRSAEPEHLYVLDLDGVPFDQRTLVISLQGLVNRDEPRIYLNRLEHDPEWIQYYKDRFGVTYALVNDVWRLVELFNDPPRRAVVYDPDVMGSLGVATTLAGQFDLLILSPDLVQPAADRGIEIEFDLRGLFADDLQAYAWELENLLAGSNPVALGNLNIDDTGVRDYLIQHRIFTFYLKAVPGQVDLLLDVLRAAPDNIPVLGYMASSGMEESLGELALSPHNKFLIPSDTTNNISVHSGIQVAPEVFSSRNIPPREFTPEQIRQSVFAAFALSDGDNYNIPVQKMHHCWDDPQRGSLPIGWSIPLTFPTLAPGVAAYYWETATDNDYFVGAIGVGYAFPSFYEDSETFIELTSRYLDYLGLHNIWILDLMLYVPMQSVADPWMVRMEQEAGLDGFVCNYFRSMATKGYTSSGAPILYSVASYPDDPAVEIAAQLDKAFERKQPGRPEFVFFGLNMWDNCPSHVVDAIGAYPRKDEVIVVNLEEMFDVMREYAPQGPGR